MATKIKKSHLEEFKKLIDQSQKIAISAHVNPDGDALGSSLALRRSLEKYKKDVDVIKLDEVDDYLSFLPELENYKNMDLEKDYDLFIILDCSEFDRIGKAYQVCEKTPKTVVLDHHVGGKISTDLDMIYSDSPATCQLVYQIIKELDLPMDETIAYLLYTGICTDTNRFMYSNVSSLTMEIAGELLDLGADFQDIYRNLYQNKKISRLKFETDALSRVSFMEDIAYVAIDQATCDKFGVQIGDAEPIVNMLRDLETIEVACILKEYGPKEYKVSLRSKDRVDVSEIARKNGGGGHIRAAGFTIEAETFEEAGEKILEILKSIK